MIFLVGTIFSNSAQLRQMSSKDRLRYIFFSDQLD